MDIERDQERATNAVAWGPKTRRDTLTITRLAEMPLGLVSSRKPTNRLQ